MRNRKHLARLYEALQRGEEEEENEGRTDTALPRDKSSRVRVIESEARNEGSSLNEV